MNKVKKVFIVIGVIFACMIIYIASNIIKGIAEENAINEKLMTGMTIADVSVYKEAWKEIPSDIEGMSIWEKYQKGLSIANGSDSDNDGLSDQEEIEVYKSNPLKASTAGDLYFDSFKIQNGMDVNKKYEYNGEKTFIYNECEEVKLEALLPSDFFAVVKRSEEIKNIAENKVYLQYKVYNFGGILSFDISKTLSENKLEQNDIYVYVSDGKSIKKVNFSEKNNLIKLRTEFDKDYTYEIYIVEKDFFGWVMVASAGVDAITDTEEEISGAGLVINSPVLTVYFNAPVMFYYETLENEEKSNALKEQIATHAKYFLDYDDESEKGVKYDGKESNIIEIKAMYEMLKRLVPFLDMTELTSGQAEKCHALFLYYSYDEKIAFEEKVEEGKGELSVVSGFNYMKDTLPFENFKSQYAEDGNCAGITHLTAYLYNTGTYPTSGEYENGNNRIVWNLQTDSNNATLLNKGLSDYKTEDFIKNNSKDNVVDMLAMSAGEIEFVKMIAASYHEGNAHAKYIYEHIYGANNANLEYDFSLIESMKNYLESGKILDVYLGMIDGTSHAVNIYGYEVESDDVIWFDVYDPNFPQNDVGDNIISEKGIRLRVEKRIKSNGNGYTFSYDYYPITNNSYGSTSNKSICENPFIIVMDEQWEILND